MAYHFEQLDQITRALMIEELQIDVNNKAIRKVGFLGFLTDDGQNRWVDILTDAIEFGDDVSLEKSILEGGNLRDTIQMNTYGRGLHTKKVQDDEASRISQHQFNRYYARAICRRAINEDTIYVEIYRAKALVANEKKLLRQLSNGTLPEATSAANSYNNKSIILIQKTIGKRLEATSTLGEIRNQDIGRSIDNALGLGIGPGGWSLRLIS